MANDEIDKKADPKDERVGRAVASARGARSQQEVADRMRQAGWKWSQATVWSVESGRRPLRFLEALDLAEVLGVRVEDLHTPLPPADQQARHDGAMLGGMWLELIDAITAWQRARRAVRAALMRPQVSEDVKASIQKTLDGATLEAAIELSSAELEQDVTEEDWREAFETRDGHGVDNEAT